MVYRWWLPGDISDSRPSIWCSDLKSSRIRGGFNFANTENRSRYGRSTMVGQKLRICPLVDKRIADQIFYLTTTSPHAHHMTTQLWTSGEESCNGAVPQYLAPIFPWHTSPSLLYSSHQKASSYQSLHFFHAKASSYQLSALSVLTNYSIVRKCPKAHHFIQ